MKYLHMGMGFSIWIVILGLALLIFIITGKLYEPKYSISHYLLDVAKIKRINYVFFWFILLLIGSFLSI